MCLLALPLLPACLFAFACSRPAPFNCCRCPAQILCPALALRLLSIAALSGALLRCAERVPRGGVLSAAVPCCAGTEWLLPRCSAVACCAECCAMRALGGDLPHKPLLLVLSAQEPCEPLTQADLILCASHLSRCHPVLQ